MNKDDKIRLGKLRGGRPPQIITSKKEYNRKDNKVYLCSSCGIYPVDYPSDLCTGCSTYEEHQY